MKKRANFKSTALTLILTLTLMLSISAISLADTTGQPPANQGGGFAQLIKTKLDSLVSAGTISADQETAVQTALTSPSGGTTPPSGSGAFAGHDFTSQIKVKLDALVTAGTISTDQETALVTALTPSSDETAPSAGAGHDFTSQIKVKLDALVTAGTISADQETAVENALAPSSDGTNLSAGTDTGAGNDFTQQIKVKLDALVTAGTISADQETAIQAALNSSSNATSNQSTTPNQNTTKGLVLKIGQSKMTVNGISQDIDPGYQTAPKIVNDRTFIPIRAIIENLGGTVDWSASDQKVTVTLNDVPIVFHIDSSQATVNGTVKVLDAPPYISSSGRTMLPLRFITENLGHTVTWDDSTQTITIQ